MSLRVAIVGAGTAGPAAAILLARAGHEVVLLERAPRKLPVGAGFLLQPTGIAVLERLGVAAELLPHTTPIHHLHCRTLSEKVLLDLHYDELPFTATGVGTHRATLLDALLDAVAKAGVEMHWNVEIKTLHRDPSGKPTLEDATGQKRGPFDLVLACDGAASALRAQSGIPRRVSRYPWGALWFIGKRTAEFDAHTLWQRVGTTRELTGFLPTGTRDDLLSLFWSIRMDRIEAWRATPLETWKTALLRLAPQAEGFLEQLRTHEQLAIASYFDVRMPHWHGDRIAMLGDSAHALSPQLGQGVNLALMDAAALADALQENSSLPAALDRYSEMRKKHLRFYQFATRWATPFFQSDLLPAGWLRDLAFPMAMKFRWARRQITSVMAGARTGFLR
ncbi:MAG: NAD(P)/FAD-dependent oxidoreductase [Chthoniobacteraceae bacterium]